MTQDIALSRGVFGKLCGAVPGRTALGWAVLGQGVSRGETWNVSERLGRPGFCDLRQNRPGGGGKILGRSTLNCRV